jgi:hypothetical protein
MPTIINAVPKALPLMTLVSLNVLGANPRQATTIRIPKNVAQWFGDPRNS